jgi:thioredoxin-like negative regulator of GroEL
MIKVTTKELLKKFDKSNTNYIDSKSCIIDFHASWCKPCAVIHDVLIELEKTNKDIIFYSVDIEEEYELAEIFSIRNLPTLLMCSKGKDVKKMRGAIGKSKIQEILSSSSTKVMV